MFAFWLTGLPAAGKSTLAAALVRGLRDRGLKPALLESDELRILLTPRPSYTEEDRDAFYEALAGLGALLVRQGIPVVFDATANLRRHRDRARRLIDRFFEVYVATPLAVCEARDPKGIYRAGRRGEALHVPGLQSPYEPPERPDFVVPPGFDPSSTALSLLAKSHTV
jgi:adenylylsulfate kinase-like enzyme